MDKEEAKAERGTPAPRGVKCLAAAIPNIWWYQI